ncbi:MAG: DUF4293 domain-containing protein [Chitinophagales bacterium]
MIQRKQTLFLICSIILLAGYLWSPVIRLEGPGIVNHVRAWEMNYNVGFPVIGHYFVYLIAIAAGISMGLNLITIFLYNRRRLQYALCLLAIIPALFCFFYVYYNWATKDSVLDTIFYYGNITPWAAVICMALAAISIRSDEALLRDSERLR